MSIIQISKIQQRSGDLVDLPQLDEAELGFASDVGRLFVGKTSGEIENIEVLTAYSDISFSQIDGANSNLAIDSTTLDDGQVLVYDGSEWTNRGGEAGGLVDLGDVSNVSIAGGGINYVLTTDGTGNLSWQPKSTTVLYIKNVTQADPGVLTTTQNHYLINGAEVTITGVQGMTQLNGNAYFAGNLTANTFKLYHDITLIDPVDTTLYSAFPYTTVSATESLNDTITVANGIPFVANMAVQFSGNTGNSLISANTPYYIKTANSTTVTVSLTQGGNIIPLANASGLSLELYATGGNITYSTGGSEGSANAAGVTECVQFNTNNLLDASATFKFNKNTNNLTLSPGNLIVGNNITANGNISAAEATFTTLNVTGGVPGTLSVGTLETTDITTGGAAIAGTITGNWTLTSGSRLQATYADLAEYYAADKHYPAGTVLDFSGVEEVTVAGIESNKIAGVVSADPAYVMNGMIKCEHPVAIALQGRVPCKVKGNVRKGDMMVSAGDGFAKAATSEPKMGTVIGKALANFDGIEGVVEVVVGRI